MYVCMFVHVCLCAHMWETERKRVRDGVKHMNETTTDYMKSNEICGKTIYFRCINI